MLRRIGAEGLVSQMQIDPSSSVPYALRTRGRRWRQFFVPLVLGTTLLLCVAASALADAYVAFNDAGLRTAVASQLINQGRIPFGSDGTTITPADMQTLTTLSASDKGIVQLGGLQYAANLVSLDLGTNRIADLSPVAGLTNLLELDVRRNRLDLSAGSPAMITIATVEGHGAHVDYQPQRLGVSKPAVSPSAPTQGKRVTFTARLTPSGAVLSGASKVLLYHFETKTVTKKIKGKKKKVKVKYWRLRRTLAMRRDSSGGLAATGKLPYAGKWEARVAYAGSADYSPCSSIAKTFVVKDRRIEAAIRWARARLGGHAWDHYCLRFVSDCYARGAGASVRRYETARQAARALGAAAHRRTNAPRGAYVFYDSTPLGHVGISLGNGTMINDYGGAGVCIMRIKSAGHYVGWAAPPVSPAITDWN